MKKLLLSLLVVLIVIGGAFLFAKKEVDVGGQDSLQLESVSQQKTETIAKAVQPEPQITLHNSGGSPKKRLRMQFTKGHSDQMVMKMKMDMQMKMNDTAGPKVNMPWIVMPMELAVRDLSSDGKANLSVSMNKVTVEKESDASTPGIDDLAQRLSFIKGTTCDYTVDTRGRTSSFDCKLGSGAPPQMNQLVEQINSGMANAYVLLPEEEVGVGAEWTVRISEFRTGPLVSSIAFNYRLEKIVGNVLHLSLRNEQAIKEQDLELPPNTPAGVKARIIKGRGEGKGSMELDLAELIPRSDMEGKVEQEMEVSHPGQGKQMLNTTIRVSVRIEGPASDTD